MNDSIAEGGCLCGQVRYEFDQTSVVTAGHCHCTDCQKATGSGKATIVFIPTEALQLNGEIKTYTVVGTAGSHVTRGFCPQCGSPIISYVEEDATLRFIKAGSLDDPGWVSPEASYWSESAWTWAPVEAGLASFQRNPD
ncbi:MAG: GFA family protein [Gammaproteobacteria bacterium]